jgi:multidrug efflux pump subunit AcrA (membrane-fusion protein)
MHKHPSLFFGAFSRKTIITLSVLFAVGAGAYSYNTYRNKPVYQFISVTRGAIEETVSITGNTMPAQSVTLAFGGSGIVSHVYAHLGSQVQSGEVLAELNTSDLAAQLRQAQANVDVQQAKLQGLQAGTLPADISAQEAQVKQAQASVESALAKLEGLKAGSRPEDIAASQAALDKANQDLLNMYGTISDTSLDSYAKANDAVRTELDPFFSNSETANAKLTYFTANSQAQTDAETQRPSAGSVLNIWQGQLLTIDRSNAGLELLLQHEITHLATVRQLLSSVSKTLDTTTSLSAATLAVYKANVSVAGTEVNTAVKNLNTILQNIASQKLTIAQLQAQLDLKRAGTLPADISAQEAQVKQAQASVESALAKLEGLKAGALPTDISAQRAQVKQAQASVESALAKLENAQILAPLSGTIIQFDAKIGQLASPGTPLVSIMSGGGYEVDSGVSETDVGKLAVGNRVTMTLDAFPGELFSGSVFFIAPSETNVQGVVSYQVKIAFDTLDPRFKSGLTANISIQTKRKENALILPQYAILQNDEGTFVEIVENNKVTRHPVTLGIQDQKGDVEVVSGVTLGEQVLNIGLKQ